MTLMSIVHWVLPVVGIGFVIFWHELGHYLAARATGVRVEAFSIGFGPRLFGFKHGTTDWKVCLIPLGGFVKMAGETPGSAKTGAKDEFTSKTVAQRSLIISAGVIMNLIFALIAIPIAFMIGVPFEAPVIGSVEVDAPAWKAGLRAGDRVHKVDGRRTLGFEDVVTAIAIGGDVVSIDAERDGAPFHVDVPTRRDPRRGLPIIGVSASLAPIEVKPEDVDPALASDDFKAAAAHRNAAGLQAGDRIEAIDGIPISELRVDDLTAPRPRRLRIARGGAAVDLTMPPLVSADQEGAPELFGLSAANLAVAGVVAGSPAATIGLRAGDRIVSIDGTDVLTYSELLSAVHGAPPGATAVIERGGIREALPGDLSSAELRRSLRADVAFTTAGRIVAPLEGGAAQAAGILRGDEVLVANGSPVAAFADMEKISSDKANKTVTLTVQRGGADSRSTVEITVARAKIPGNEAFLGLEDSFVREVVRTGFVDSLAKGFDYTVMMTARVFMTLKSLFTRRVSAEHLGGIITIFRQSHESSRIGFARALLFLAVISINLAVLNVLPIPVLDGGWLLLLLIEKIRGKPVSERVLGVVSWIGFGLVLSLMLFATWNDIKRLF